MLLTYAQDRLDLHPSHFFRPAEERQRPLQRLKQIHRSVASVGDPRLAVNDLDQAPDMMHHGDVAKQLGYIIRQTARLIS